LVDQNSASWNQIGLWIRKLDALRAAASLDVATARPFQLS